MISGGELKDFLAMQERVRELEEKVQELESQLTVARGIHPDLRSELSTLREQSKRNCYTLGEPEPEVPQFKGTVRNTVTGKVYYVLWPKGAQPSLVSPEGYTLHYDGFPPKNHELYNHPSVPNTPELIAALEESVSDPNVNEEVNYER